MSESKNPWIVKKKVTIPRIPGSKTQPDEIVSVNGKVFKIQRGVEVEVPEPIYEAIENSLKASEAADEYYYNKASN